MSKTKTLKQFVFLALMCLSAVLLCFVGVYATGQLNLKYYGNVSPDIFCKIEYSTNDGSSYTTLFDNYAGTSGTYPLTQIKLSTNTGANAVTFKLTNYTVGKHIRLSIKNPSNNNNYLQIGCDAATTGGNNTVNSSTPQSETWTITGGAVEFNVVVEPAYKVTTQGTGLANAGHVYYCSELDTNPSIPLTTSVGYQLPQSVSATDVTCSRFDVTNNANGFAKLGQVTQDCSVTCNCEQVFTIFENTTASSLTSNGGYHQTNGENLLPNNGYYSIDKNDNGEKIVYTSQSTDLPNGVTLKDDKNYYHYTTGLITFDVYLPLGTNFNSANYPNYSSHTSNTIIFWQKSNSTPIPLDSSANYFHKYTTENETTTIYVSTDSNTQLDQNGAPDSTEITNDFGVSAYNGHAGVNEYYYFDSSESKYKLIPYNELYYKYTVTTNGGNFKEYKYYVEMGYYPQSLVDEIKLDDDNKYIIPEEYESTNSYYSQTINKTQETLQMYKNKTDNDYYVLSPIKLNPNSVGLKIDSTDVTSGYGMFKLEPITWIVVGAKEYNTTQNAMVSKDLDSLYFKENMFYTDSIYGKPFAGQLELLSAYGLDATAYDPVDTNDTKYHDSPLNKLLNTNNSFNHNSLVLNNSSHLLSLKNNYILQQNINTFEITKTGTGIVETTDVGLFELGFGVTGEDYVFGSYFKQKVPELADGATYSLGVTSLSDFAIAHNGENGRNVTTKLSTSESLAVTKGWGAGNSTIPNKAACAYWLRTADAATSTYAYLINLNGDTTSTTITDDNICIRPFTVLDMSYYHHSASNKTYKFYGDTYKPPEPQTT